MKYLQHTFEIDETLWNMRVAIATCATPKSTFETFRRNICNIRFKHLKHLKHTLATCLYSYCNIDNIQMKHLKMYVWNTWNTWNTTLSLTSWLSLQFDLQAPTQWTFETRQPVWSLMYLYFLGRFVSFCLSFVLGLWCTLTYIRYETLFECLYI
jgi:hypothetical protein